MLVQSESKPLLSYCSGLMSGGTDLSLFLILVLAPGDGKDEGKEPETDSEFVDIKGICCWGRDEMLSYAL